MADMCVTCGMPPKNKDDTIPITLLYSRASKQVVCLEVGKEFVDMLMGFLTLPISCLVRVLAEASMIHKPDEIKSPPIVPASVSNNLAPMKSDPHFALSAISNVFESVVKMKNDKMAVDKRTLLQAQPTFPFGAGKLLKTKSTPTKSEEMVHPDSGFYNCGVACNYATAIIQTTCPKHKQPMITAIKMVEESPVESTVKKTTEAAGSVQRAVGYVKPETKFMVTNQLEIFASSSMKALITLEMIRSERVGDLDTMEISVVSEEVLMLLKASFLSTNVLNDVFGKYCSDAKRNTFQQGLRGTSLR
ncbi:uncharacterized protein [Physcomitrium patens]|uniref:uncharacterized protein isoform X2 n=1 Tax=Physcomitrium patens TaxID=3218 RepID=UPI003CCCF633